MREPLPEAEHSNGGEAASQKKMAVKVYLVMRNPSGDASGGDGEEPESPVIDAKLTMTAATTLAAKHNGAYVKKITATK